MPGRHRLFPPRANSLAPRLRCARQIRGGVRWGGGTRGRAWVVLGGDPVNGRAHTVQSCAYNRARTIVRVQL